MMMTPVTLPIDRRFKGVGRINRASGTTDRKIKHAIERMLRTLFEQGRLDILRAIRDGQIGFLETYDAFRRHALHQLPIGDTMPKLSAAFAAWIESLTVDVDYAAESLEAFETARRYFEKARTDARVADLPAVLEQLRNSLGAKHPRSFNGCRATALAFVRATLKRSHPIYIACAAVEKRKTPKRKPRAPISPALFRQRFPTPESDPIDAGAWSMATTGMGPKEYWGEWSTRSDRVHIEGTKRVGRVRDVPLVRAPAVSQLGRDRFEKRFRERMRGVMTIYDLRRTYAQWLEAAGIPRTRRRLYMGQGTKDVLDLYESHDISGFLADDAKTLAAFLAKKPTTRIAEVAG